MGAGFKVCTHCGFRWEDRASFLADATVQIVGYQANYDHLDAGIFLFQHMRDGCETTLAIEAGRFTDLHEGPIFEKRMTGTPGCRGLCKIRANLESCDQECDCAYVRDVIQRVKGWPKKAA